MKQSAPDFRLCFFQMPMLSTMRSYEERTIMRCVGTMGFSLVSGSTEMSISNVSVEIDSTSLAVSMSALSNLKQLALITLLV